MRRQPAILAGEAGSIAQYRRAADFLRAQAAQDGFRLSIDGQNQLGFTATPQQFANAELFLDLAFRDPLTRQQYHRAAEVELSLSQGLSLARRGGRSMAKGVFAGMQNQATEYAKLATSAADSENFQRLAGTLKQLASKSMGALMDNIFSAVAQSGEAAVHKAWLAWVQSDSEAMGHKAGEILGATLVDVLAQGAGLGVIRASGRVVDGLGVVHANMVRRVEAGQLDADNNAKIVAAPTPGALRVFNGVEVHPNMLGDPAAGWGYAPSAVPSQNPNIYWSHWVGHQRDLEVARYFAEQGQMVIKWGGNPNSQGSDSIVLNPATAEITLVDSKFRKSPTTIKMSGTFDFNPSTNPNAQQQLARVKAEALRALEVAPISTELRNAATANVNAMNVRVVTAGSGAVRHSPVVRLCGGVPC